MRCVCSHVSVYASVCVRALPSSEQEAEITRLLQAPGDLGIPGCVGARNIRDNLSDLRAQVAANQRGILLVGVCIPNGAPCPRQGLPPLRNRLILWIGVQVSCLECPHQGLPPLPPLPTCLL